MVLQITHLQNLRSDYPKFRTANEPFETPVLMHGIMFLEYYFESIEFLVKYKNENENEGFDLPSYVSNSTYVQFLVKCRVS